MAVRYARERSCVFPRDVRYSPLSSAKGPVSDDSDMHGLFVEAHRLGVGTSPVSQWLLANAREFADELAKVRRPNWAKLALTLYERRSVGSSRGPVSGRALRDAWYRVRLYLAERGEEWVEFKRAPRGSGKLVKRRRVAREPVGARDPAQAKEAAPAPADPEPASSFADVLRDASKARTWVTKIERKD